MLLWTYHCHDHNMVTTTVRTDVLVILDTDPVQIFTSIISDTTLVNGCLSKSPKIFTDGQFNDLYQPNHTTCMPQQEQELFKRKRHQGAPSQNNAYFDVKLYNCTMMSKLNSLLGAWSRSGSGLGVCGHALTVLLYPLSSYLRGRDHCPAPDSGYPPPLWTLHPGTLCGQ